MNAILILVSRRAARMAIAVLCTWAAAAAAQISVYPLNPNALETTRVLIPEYQLVADAVAQGYNSVLPYKTRVSMANNRLTVTMVLNNNGFPNVNSPAIDIPLGQLPAGAYQLEVRRETDSGAPLSSLGEVSFTVAARRSDEPLWNNTDVWWNASESGWGISVVQHGARNIFGTLYIYDADGKPVWYVMPGGTWVSPSTFNGNLYRTSGPQFASTFDASKVTVTPVGSAILDFVPLNYDHASLVVTIDGKTLTKTIQRQSF